MERFRVMQMYVASVLLALSTAIAGVAWLKQPPREASVRDGADPAAANADAARLPEGSAPPTTHPAAAPVTVAINDFAFAPRDLSVAVGTIVTWVNHDDVPHTATSSDGPASFDSRALDTDERFSFTFTTPGTYQYYCKAHPHMRGTVVVK